MRNGSTENPDTEVEANCNERVKKLYRYVSDISRRIDEAMATCKTVNDLFSTNNSILRHKLKDNCEKLMFTDPINYGKKSLELIWRKAFYDTVSAAKKLNEEGGAYDNYLFTHIVCGIGHFHHLISAIQFKTKLIITELDYFNVDDDDLNEKRELLVDDEMQNWGRGMIHMCCIFLGDLSRYQSEIFHTFDQSISARYYLQAAHIDLCSGMPYNQLGNLYLEKNHNLDSIAYYIQCLSCSTPFEGAMGNLLKLLEKNSQQFEILNSNICPNVTQTEHVQNSIIRFLYLTEIWYFDKVDSEISRHCSVAAADFKIGLDFKKLPLPDLNSNYDIYLHAVDEEALNPSYFSCNTIYKIVQICIFTISKMTETDETKAFAAKAFTLALLSQLLQKLLQQLEICGFQNPSNRYKKKNEIKPKILSSGDCPSKTMPIETDEKIELQNGVTKDEIEVVDVKNDINADSSTIENGDIKSKKLSRKRRRRRRVASSSSSNISDSESSCVGDSESDKDDQFDSDHSDVDSKSDHSNEDYAENSDIEDEQIVQSEAVITNIADEKETVENNIHKVSENENDEDTLNAKEIQKFLSGDNFLPSIKLLQDWALTEKELVLSCGDSGEALFQCVIDLLNIFNAYFSTPSNGKYPKETCNILDFAQSIVHKVELEYNKIPLPEDVNLRGTNICKFDKNATEWDILNQYKPSVYEENVIRILHFIDFGHQIAKFVPKIRYNRTLQVFYLKKVCAPKLNTQIKHKRNREWHNSKKPHGEAISGGEEGGLLHRLGRLWLASRVKELERWGRTHSATLLVVDSSALHKHLARVKQLAKARSFLILVPTIVLQELDDLKREEGTARDAIRWLEKQLQSGSRYLRAQRPNQSRPLPLIKYPRKAPTNILNFIQILEFCNHFVTEEKSQGDGDVSKTSSMLVLITGNDAANFDECKEFSVTGAARSAGISIEHINQFYTKWRQVTHKKR